MHAQVKTQAVDKSKTISILILSILSTGIVLIGALLCVYSIIHGISFTVFNNPIHGVVFGLLVLFLGIRYFLSVQKLKTEIYKPTSKFSWSNFKKH